MDAQQRQKQFPAGREAAGGDGQWQITRACGQVEGQVTAAR
ncbi:hypothetical protein AB0C61_30340 [Streptomyces sp. NPDC048680]